MRYRKPVQHRASSEFAQVAFLLSVPAKDLQREKHRKSKAQRQIEAYDAETERLTQFIRATQNTKEQAA